MRENAPIGQPSQSHDETSDTYDGVIARLCPRYRVVMCNSDRRWILQRRTLFLAGQARWTSIGYFRKRMVLILCSEAVCDRPDPVALQTLEDLPHEIGGAS
jgi:hypothetical protein